MSISAACTVKDGAAAPVDPTNAGANVTPGNLVTVALASAAGVDAWSLTLFGQDELVVPPVVTVNSVAKTATFTAPAAGSALLYRSSVTSYNGVDTYGRSPLVVSSTFGVYALLGGQRVGATNETVEGSAAFGWVTKINALVRALVLGGGAGGGPPPPPSTTPDFLLAADVPASITSSGGIPNVVSVWGPAASQVGTPLLVTDVVGGGNCIRFDTGSSLAIPAGLADFFSQGAMTLAIVWRARQYANTGGVPYPILDSSGNGATRGFQLLARDNSSGTTALRRLQARVTDGSTWLVNSRNDSNVDNDHYAPLKWCVTILQLSATRAALWVDGVLAFDDALSAVLPAGAPGPLVIGGSKIDIKLLAGWHTPITDTAAKTQAVTYAARAGTDMLVQVAGVPTNSTRYIAYPAAITLGDGSIFATYYDSASGDVSADTYIRVIRSTDKMVTWSVPVTLASPPNIHLTGAVPTLLANGHIVMSGCGTGTAIAPQSQGSFYFKSTDGGNTWSTPTRFTHGGTDYELSSAHIVENAGSLYWPVYSGVIGDGTHSSAYLWVSTDEGATWPTVITLANGTTDNKKWAEPLVIKLAGGTFLCLLRDQTNGQQWECTSTNLTTWTTPVFAFASQAIGGGLTQLASGRVVTTARARWNSLGASLYERLAPGSWTDVPRAQGLDGSQYSYVYGEIIETTPGVMSILYGRQQDFASTKSDVVARVGWKEWQIDGNMPMTATPPTVTLAHAQTQQITANGAGGYTYPGTFPSTGSVSAGGIWTAGNTAGADTIHVTDLNGQVVTLTYTSTGGGVAAFDPTVIGSGASLWLKQGALITGIKWTDQIAGYIHDYTGAAPTVAGVQNSLTGLTYDGATQWGTLPSTWYSRTAGTLILVVRPIASSTSAGIGYSNNCIMGDGGGYWGVFVKNTPAIIADIYDSANREIDTTIPTLPTTFIFVMRWNGTLLKCNVAGVEQTPIACTGAGGAAGVMTIGKSAPFAHFFNGVIWEIAGWNTSLSDADQTTAITELQAKYAL
jgi:hypothetical protein